MKYDGNDDGYLSREDVTSRTSEKLLKVTLINIFRLLGMLRNCEQAELICILAFKRMKKEYAVSSVTFSFSHRELFHLLRMGKQVES